VTAGSSGASLKDFVPVSKLPTRHRAIEVMAWCRGEIEGLIAGVADERLVEPSVLGGGSWSIKDLIGHLATHEETALSVLRAGSTERFLTDQPSGEPSYLSVDAFNDHHVDRKGSWSLDEVRDDAASIRAQLLAEIEATTDERWQGRIQVVTGRSALGLVLGKILNGGRFGYFTHDLAHHYDLRRSVKALA
jgi:hypothetical protein